MALVTSVTTRQCFWPSCPSVDQKDLKLQACASCNFAHYCSHDCQRKDWTQHKLTCISPVAIHAQEKLGKELFKRLPKSTQEALISSLKKGSCSASDLALLNKDPTQWRDLEQVRVAAIRACLEEKISEQEMGYYLLYCMVKETQNVIPGVECLVTSSLNPIARRSVVNNFCRVFDIENSLLGDPATKADTFFVVSLKQRLDPKKDYHYTAFLALDSYPFVANIDQSRLRGDIVVFLPHIYERLLASRYPENPEKPLFVLGAKDVEKLSDNLSRVMSMTGGITIPTPKIEANKALSLIFYLHDGYHVMLDSAIGSHRPFWNAFGKRLLDVAKQTDEPLMKEAFACLGPYCLDKEFNDYLTEEKPTALVLSLFENYQVAGKKPNDDSEEPFCLISDEGFVVKVREKLLREFKEYWAASELRQQITQQELLEAIAEIKSEETTYHTISDRDKEWLKAAFS